MIGVVVKVVEGFGMLLLFVSALAGLVWLQLHVQTLYRRATGCGDAVGRTKVQFGSRCFHESLFVLGGGLMTYGRAVGAVLSEEEAGFAVWCAVVGGLVLVLGLWLGFMTVTEWKWKIKKGRG